MKEGLEEQKQKQKKEGKDKNSTSAPPVQQKATPQISKDILFKAPIDIEKQSETSLPSLKILQADKQASQSIKKPMIQVKPH